MCRPVVVCQKLCRRGCVEYQVLPRCTLCQSVLRSVRYGNGRLHGRGVSVCLQYPVGTYLPFFIFSIGVYIVVRRLVTLAALGGRRMKNSTPKLFVV